MTSSQVAHTCMLVLMSAVCGLNAPTDANHSTATASGSITQIFTSHAVFPKDNPWNVDISQLPVDPNSAAYIATIGANKPLHPDFGTGINGIPFQFVDHNTRRSLVTFEYADESDKGPYPIPAHPLIEGGPAAASGDRHLLLIDSDDWMLYELWRTVKGQDGWHAGSGAIWNLKTNAMRPKGWTSADAAGLPIFPGLVRYDEVHEKRLIAHALRFTVQRTRRAFIFPASHWASNSNDPHLLPMGARLRLRHDFDVNAFDADAQVILTAMKTYGMILADNGSDWYISGAPDDRWNDDILHQLAKVKGKDLEVVQLGQVVVAP
jgi:hypothetical protein